MSDPVGHISSAVVTAKAEHAAGIAARIAQTAGNEIHAVSGHRIIVVMEGANVAALADRLTAIAALPGVLSALMVFEQALDTEPMSPA